MKIDKKLIKELVDNLKEFEVNGIRITKKGKLELKFQKFLEELRLEKQVQLCLQISQFSNLLMTVKV